MLTVNRKSLNLINKNSSYRYIQFMECGQICAKMISALADMLQS